MPIIINGASRCDGDWWTKHLGNEEANELVATIEYEGLSAGTMRDAFREMEALAAGTQCDNYFYQANINPRADEILTPQQWRQAIDTLEHNLGLAGQPRFVVQHEKEGRLHHHIVWSRIDQERGVAISDSFTARIHEQTSRELEIKFDLERGKSILVADRDFERPERRLKKWETFRGASSGIDPNEMKAELSAIRQRCDGGIGFRAALEESGAYVLALGDRRDYVIIDREGDDHSLARRLDLTAAKLRKFMADLDPSTVPSVEQAKAIQREREAEGQHWDRDAADRSWESTIANAAIKAAGVAPPTPGASKSKVADGAEQDAPAARGAYAALETRTEAALQEAEAPAGKTKSDIRAALAASRDADPFAASEKFQAELKERGIGLAEVSAEEAYGSERVAAFARQIGNYSRKLAEGEIIAVDSRGHAYRLDERVTRQPKEVVEERLAGIDREELPNLEDAKEAVREANRAAWRAQKEDERAQARTNEPVSGARAEIRMAFALTPDSPNEAALQEALAARGMTLARATADEAAASVVLAERYAEQQKQREQAGDVTAAGRYAGLRQPDPDRVHYSPRLSEGEIVAVDQRGRVHKLDERSTGLRKTEIEARVSGIDDLSNITDAREAMRETARESWKAEQAAKREEARDPSRMESRIAECARLAELGAHIQLCDSAWRRDPDRLPKVTPPIPPFRQPYQGDIPPWEGSLSDADRRSE